MAVKFFRMSWKGFWLAGVVGCLVILLVAVFSRWSGVMPIQMGLALALAAGRVAEAVYTNSSVPGRVAVETCVMFAAGLLLALIDEFIMTI